MEDIKRAVRETYGEIASRGGSCCASDCCTPSKGAEAPDERWRKLGYGDAEASAAPQGANLGLGCGNPQAVASLRPGEVVLDLGSGGGFDCFLAAQQVGPEGRVVGVDMTAEMVSLARDNAVRAGSTNVEFRLGEIEHLPVQDSSVDVIMSNCVINLVPDKAAVYREALRVLRPGGRLAISDIVARAPLPAALQADLATVAGCIGGAATVDETRTLLADAGFVDIRIRAIDGSDAIIGGWDESGTLEDLVISASIEGVKPQP